MQERDDGHHTETSAGTTVQTTATRSDQADAPDDGRLVEALWDAEERVARWRAWALRRVADDAAQLWPLLVAARKEASGPNPPDADMPSARQYLALQARVDNALSLVGHGLSLVANGPHPIPKPNPPRWDPPNARNWALIEREILEARYRGLARTFSGGVARGLAPNPLEGVEDLL